MDERNDLNSQELTPKNVGDFSAGQENAEQENIENNIYSNNNEITNKKNTASQKMMFGVILFLGLGILIYSFVNLGNTIYSSSNALSETEKNSIIEQSNAINDLLEMQNRDTDKDGLTDYDEQYVYKTSPYLPDTDSDGYMDKEEIDGGYDPLCPKGVDCRGTTETETSSESSAIQENFSEELPEEAPEISDELKQELNSLTPDQVRELLLTTGQLTQEQLDEIDDITLMQIFQEVIDSQE